jgi:uncharacterized protein (DUF433 family)
MKSSVIHSDPDILSGEPVFRGTRVPVRALFDYLEHSTLEEFFNGYPQVTKEMVREVLKLAAQKVSTKPRRRHESAAG